MRRQVTIRHCRSAALLIAIAATVVACEQRTPVAPSSVLAGGDSASNKKGGNQCAFGFTVTFNDSASNKLRSDGLGTYVDGVAKVMAFTGNGPGFRLDTNGGSQKLEGAGGLRNLLIDFTGVLAVPPAPFASANKGTDLRFYLADGGLDLCTLATVGSSGTVGLTVPFEVPGSTGNTMTLTYGVPTSQDDPTLIGQRVVVTRTATSPDTWTVVGQYAGLRNGWDFSEVVAGASNLYMPFMMTLVRK